MSGPAPRPFLLWASLARAVSWPLAAFGIVLGLCWRLLAVAAYALRAGGDPDRGAPLGLRRLEAFWLQGLSYLGWQTDHYPAFDGSVRSEGESPGPSP